MTGSLDGKIKADMVADGSSALSSILDFLRKIKSSLIFTINPTESLVSMRYFKERMKIRMRYLQK